MPKEYATTYTQGGNTHEVHVVVPPSLPCPTCGMCLAVTDDVCGRCERVFHARELWELVEAREAGAREAREAADRHYR